MNTIRKCYHRQLCIAFMGVFLASFNYVSNARVPWLPDYTYRKPILITGTTNGAQTHYQVCVSNVAYNAHMQTNFADIRFGSSDGVTLDHWLELKTDSTAAIYWVKVANIPAGPDTTAIYMYYGNADATSASSVSNTFIREINGDQPVMSCWHFDETSGTNAFDSSGNANKGTGYGTTITNGKFNNALYFLTNDYVTAAASPSLNVGAGSFSFAVWLLLDQSGDRTILDKGNMSWVNRPGFSWLVTGGKARLAIADGTNGYTVNDAPQANASLVNGVWYHLAVSWDGTTKTAQYYHNGVTNGSFTTNGLGSASNNVTLHIGRKTDTRYFSGIIDELQIYNRVLSTNEVWDLYNNYGHTTTNDPGRILVRKFATPEPSTGDPGAEERFCRGSIFSVY